MAGRAAMRGLLYFHKTVTIQGVDVWMSMNCEAQAGSVSKPSPPHVASAHLICANHIQPAIRVTHRK